MEMKGAKILMESLLKEGVDTIFGYPGGAVLDIYDELYNYQNKGLRHILVRHEQAAAHAADGYARTTGKVGVCFATSGPGATNLVTGIATANMDSIPIVAITGQVATSAIGTDAFQEADMTGITQPITKHNFLVKDVKDLALTIKEAFHIARTGRPGPVLVDIPKDVTQKMAEFHYPKNLEMPNYQPTIKGHTKQIQQAVQILTQAERPVIISGGGVISANGSTELREFARVTTIPVAPTLMGLGSIPSNDKNNLGMPGMHGTATANYAIHNADLLIAIGMRFDDRITGKISTFAPQAKVIHIDIDPAEINKVISAQLPIIGDAREILIELLAELKKVTLPSYEKWHQQLNDWQKKHPLLYDQSGKSLKPQYIIEEVSEQAGPEAIFVTDVGTHQMWSCQYLNFKKPRHWASSGGLGTMGYGLPAAMGAAIGNPKNKVVLISGDGSIQMNIQELGTIATNDIPVKIFILNNFYLGMVRQWQEFFYGKRLSHTDLSKAQPDFAKLAEVYGLKGFTIKSKLEAPKIIKQALTYKGAALVNVLIEREENVFPMVPSGGILNKMLFQENYRESLGLKNPSTKKGRS